MRAIVVAGLVGCGSSAPAMIDAAPHDDAELPMPDAATGWETVTQVSNSGGVIVEDVSYHSGPLKILAHVCRPTAAGAHTAIVYNHGGFDGLQIDPALAECQTNAAAGYVWIASQYRGEGGSEGTREICLGEVDDVLAMLPIVKSLPYVDPEHVWMWGGSHGGCITQRALQRGAKVRAAFDAFGPIDWTALFQYWQTSGDATDQQLMAMLQSAAGTPTSNPSGYAARSPKNFIADFPADIPLSIAHGTADTIVPVAQSCELAMLIGAESYHDDGAGTDATTLPTGCEASGLAVHAGPRPRPSWPGKRYFVAYDGLGHEIASASAQTMLQDAATFFMAK